MTKPLFSAPAFVELLGESNVLTQAADRARYETDWRGFQRSECVAVLRPGTTEEVSACVRLCAAQGLAIVPQAGNSGLTFGSNPNPAVATPQVVLSLERMNRVRALDLAGNCMTVDAGVVLQTVQEHAGEANRFFALDLGARGSCRIGGNISTNAGGVNVLAYGNCRDQVLGLEVVLADGRVWDGLSALRKDNSGYDLKQLFIGAEGTLGIVTGATLKLNPKPVAHLTLLGGVPSPDAALELLGRFRSLPLLTSFELMHGAVVQEGKTLVDSIIDPLETAHPWYILSEHSLFSDADSAEASLFDLVEAAMEDGLLSDATLAQSEAQAQALWEIRHGTTPLQAARGASVKHDVSVPVSLVPELIERGTDALRACVPDCRPLPFGHLGDGNLHFNVNRPLDMADEAFRPHTAALNEALHQVVLSLGGSISAEHGIGLLRRDELLRTKDPVALDMMRAIKAALDPDNRLNPGKVF